MESRRPATRGDFSDSRYAVQYLPYQNPKTAVLCFHHGFGEVRSRRFSSS